MNTSTTRQRYTVITVTERDYMELTADPSYAVLGYQTFEYIENNTITRLFTVFIKRTPEVKPDNFKPLLKAIATTANNLSTFKVGQIYKIGNLVNTAGRVVAITKSTIKVNFLIAVYDKKIDCFQWWESKEPKTYKIKDNITSQVIFVDHHGTKLHMLSSELSNIDEGSIRTAINNPFLPKEVHNTLYQLNGHKTGSYYWYDR